MRRLLAALALLAGALAPSAALGQAASAAPEPGAELRVYLMTIGPGVAVWQRFGHNAVWIEDARTGQAVAYNWGMFDFDQPNFIGRFLTGDTRYSMEAVDARLLTAHYAQQENRSVWRQELALTPAQRAQLLRFIEWNGREENKYYRYQYYVDNCSTRARDAIDRVLGGTIRRALEPVPTATSYRWHTRRLSTGNVGLYAGIQLALGRPADGAISAWDEGFLPVRLMEHLRAVRTAGPGGAPTPLVLREDTLYVSTRAPEPAAPPSSVGWFAALGIGIAALVAWLGALTASATRRAASSPASAGLAVLGTAWTLVTGLAGVALLLAGTVTRHVEFMGRNLNLAVVNPLALVLLVLLLAAFGLRRPPTRARWARRAAAAAALLAAFSAVGALLMAIPATWQRSWDVYALALPVNLALWWALSRVARAGAPRHAMP